MRLTWILGSLGYTLTDSLLHLNPASHLQVPWTDTLMALPGMAVKLSPSNPAVALARGPRSVGQRLFVLNLHLNVQLWKHFVLHPVTAPTSPYKR